MSPWPAPARHLDGSLLRSEYGINAGTFSTTNLTVDHGATVASFTASGNAVTYTITSAVATWGASPRFLHDWDRGNQVQDNLGNYVSANATFATLYVDTSIPTATLTSPPPTIDISAGASQTLTLTVMYGDPDTDINPPRSRLRI